jgi:hypothetical protein
MVRSLAERAVGELCARYGLNPKYASGSQEAQGARGCLDNLPAAK